MVKDYPPFGLVMAGISSKSAGGLENKKKYNGIELNSDFNITIGETFFRSHDPQLGRWLQIDPKPNKMHSPYSAMNNNPLFLSDPMGDTTWVYDAKGALAITITDNKKNQIHFGSFTNEKEFEPITISGKKANSEATWWRKNSTAFIGSKTLADMESISKNSENVSKKASVEIGFIGMISASREIRLTALPIDNLNTDGVIKLGAQIDKNYPGKKAQAGIFLFGHVHPGSFIGVRGDPGLVHNYLGRPTTGYDYLPYLYRTGNATAKGQSPALLLTAGGVTVYGTGTSATYGLNGWQVENAVYPSQKSYILYSQLKH